MKHDQSWPWNRVLVAGVCIAIMAAGCSARRSEQHRLEGDAYLQLGKYAEAAEAYRKAEVANPQNAMAQVGLGRCLFVQQRYDEALAAFRHAMELDPAAEAPYAESVNVLLKQDRVDEAVAWGAKFEEADPEHGGLLHAFVLERAGRPAEAVTLLARLRDQFPQSVDVRLSLAGAYLLVKQPDLAEAELSAVLGKLDQDSIPARVVQAEVYKMQGKADAMVAEYQKLVDQNPKDMSLKLALARSLVFVGRLDEAQQITEAVLAQEPRSGWANYVMGCCLLERKQYAEAVSWLETADRALPHEAEIARSLAIARTGGAAGAPATPVAKAAAAEAPIARARADDWPALWRQAALTQLLQGRAAFLAQGAPNVAETLALAAVFTNNMTLADELAARLPAGSPVASYLAGLKENNLPALLQQLDQWAEQDPDRQVLRENALAFALGRAGGRARAVQVLSKCLEIQPDNVVCLFNMAQVFRSARMPEFAARTLQRLLAKYPNNLDALLLLFVTLRDGGMEREARNAAETAYNLNRDSRDAALNLAQACLDTHDAEMARMVLERGLQTQPDDVALKEGLAGVLLHSGKAADALKLLEGAASTPELAVRKAVLTMLSAALLGDWPRVVELGNGVAPAAQSATTRLLIAAAQIQSGKMDAAAAALAPAEGDVSSAGRAGGIILQALGQGVPELVPEEAGLGALLSKDRALLGTFAFGAACQSARLYDAAFAELAKLEETAGENPRYIQMLFGSLAKCEPSLKPGEVARAFAERHAACAAAWIGLAQVMQAAADAKGERAACDKAVETGPANPEAWLQQAECCERNRDMACASAAYRRLVELRPDDAVANNNLAYCLLMSGGDVQEALQRATAAIGKLGTQASALHTLGVAQLRAGKLEDSNKNLSMALELRPGDPTLLLDYGQLLIALNRADEGKRHIQLAIRYADQLGLDFPRRAEAEKIIGTPAASA